MRASAAEPAVENEHSDWIHLSKIGFPCIVGLHDDEQRTPQALELELSMGLDLEPAAAGELERSVHYVHALDQVQFIAEHGRWRLLESLVAAIARHLLRPPALGEGRAALARVRVRAGKPAYLRGRALPAVEITRERRWVGAAPSAPESGSVAIYPLQVTQKSGAYHADLGAGAEFAVPDGTHAHLLAGELAGHGRGSVLSPGERARSTLASRLLVVGSPF